MIKENEYGSLLHQVLSVISDARTNIARHLASSVSNTYWGIGQLLHERKLESAHGSSVVKRLSMDLKARYPDMGFSPRNLWDMKRFYLRYCKSDIKLRQAVAVLPWSQNLLLMREFGCDDQSIRYYAQESISKGWSRDLLLNAIRLKMHECAAPIPEDNV